MESGWEERIKGGWKHRSHQEGVKGLVENRMLIKEVLQGTIIVVLLEKWDINALIEYRIIMIKLDTKTAGITLDTL